jgi:hypothetical protein
VIKASGKDTRGNGTAAATVTVTLRADGDATAGSVNTDLSITGKPAQFGRGLISEVGGKILDSFASCLASKLAPEQPAEPPPAKAEKKADKRNAAESPKLSVVDSAHAEAAATGAAAGRAAARTAPPVAETKPKLAAVEPRPEPQHESEPIDLLAYAAPSVIKRVVPLVAGLLVLVVVFRLLRRRG